MILLKVKQFFPDLHTIRYSPYTVIFICLSFHQTVPKTMPPILYFPSRTGKIFIRRFCIFMTIQVTRFTDPKAPDTRAKGAAYVHEAWSVSCGMLAARP